MAIADWPAEKLTRIRALLAEDAAVLVQKYGVDYAGGDGATRSRTKLVRRWPRISDGDRADCEAFLRAYSSAKNAEPSRTVTDPQADKEVHPGTWRPTRTDLSRIKTDPNEQGVYQTLVCPADAADGDGAWPSEEDWLHHVHTESATGAAPLQLPCGRPPRGTRLSVDARLDKETGEWDSQKRTDESRPDTYAYTDGTPLATSAHVKGEHQDEVPSATASPGKTVQINAEMDAYGQFSTHKVETTAHEKSTGPYTASSNALQSTTEESVRNAPKAPSAGENEDVSAHLNEFGRVDYNKRKTTPKPAEARAESGEWTEKTTSLAYRNADAEKNSIDGVESPHAIVPSATAHRNEFGKVDGSVQATEPIERSSGPHTVEQTALRKVESTFHFNKESVPAATSSGGTITTYHPRVNRFGLIDLEERKTSPGTEGVNSWKRIYPATWWTETVYTMEFRNWTDVPKKEDFGAREPLASYGVLSNHNVNFNDLNLFDGYLVLTVPVEQESPEVVIEDTDLRKTTVQNFFNKRNAPPAASSSANSITTCNARQNRFGLWDYEKRTTTLKPKDGVEYTSEDTDQHTTKVQQKFNQEAPEQAQKVLGTVQTVNNRLNESGSYDTEKRTTTYNAVEGTEYKSEDAFFGNTQVQQKFNQDAPEQAQKDTGTVQTVHSRLNEAGRYDTEVRTETAEAKDTGEITIEDNPERTVKIQHFYNQQTKPSNVTSYTASGGTVVETSYTGIQINRFGLWDYTKVTTTHKGGRGDGTQWSWTVKVAEGWGAYGTTSFPYKGRQITLVDWRRWYRTSTTTVKKRTSYADAAADLSDASALLGAPVTKSAHIESGGGGIFYSVKTTVSEVIWTGTNNQSAA